MKTKEQLESYLRTAKRVVKNTEESLSWLDGQIELLEWILDED